MIRRRCRTGRQAQRDRAGTSPRPSACPPRGFEPGRAIAGPGTVTLYQVGTVKDVAISATAHRRYVSVDGGMSDNIRTSLYGAEYDARLLSRTSDAPARLARIVGKHCERRYRRPGHLGARRRGPGDLLASPPPAPTAIRCRAGTTCGRPPWWRVATGRRGLILRRETVDDLLSLEVVERG
jgi:diaminopimelate decarboxylase